MKDKIEFYYNIQIDEFHNKNDYYYFNIGNDNFIFKPFIYPDNRIEDIYKLNRILMNKIDISLIILNRYNTPITVIDNKNYVLIRDNKKEATIYDIANTANAVDQSLLEIKSLERVNWEVLWENKIDYFELQIGENKKKYPLIRESFDYFIGLGENAISYLVNTKREVASSIYDNKVISHNNLREGFYDPTNIILDHRARDLAEYIKISFFYKESKDIFNELDNYFYYNRYSEYGIRVLFSRVLYPSLYFVLYEDIIRGLRKEEELNIIISRIDEYERYLYDVYLYLRKYYNIPSIIWLSKSKIKKWGFSPHLRLLLLLVFRLLVQTVFPPLGLKRP